MKVGVLTSSRADYGIYQPLLRKLRDDAFFDLNIIAFGTHLSPFHGETISQILQDGIEVKYTIESMLLTDSAESVSTAMGLTTIKFANFWKEHYRSFDVVLCLGDRYEMFSAVVAGIAFNIPFAHLHGGETTLGAIDNVFRHSISLAAKYHFVSTLEYKERVASIVGLDKDIFYVGALSLDNIKAVPLLSLQEFNGKWNVDLSKKTVLTTFHPESLDIDRNESYAKELVDLIKLNDSLQFLITMPNADATGSKIRKIFEEHLGSLSNVFLIENLGSSSYFTAMKYSSLLLGNTSSGIIEAASFGKYVVNIGDRQKGRACGPNVLHVSVTREKMQERIDEALRLGDYTGENIYYVNDPSSRILYELKRIYRETQTQIDV